ncbi:MAG: MBL fold metallo-hydrolase [Clostridia bacterium]|nr:MBL fold metallo-hydrolase [Clostridia bacterium]
MKRLLCLLLTFTLVVTCAVYAYGENAVSRLTLFALNVRKADCLLLSSGDDLYMIDTGSAESWGQVSRYLKEQSITSLKGVILTHTDADHAGGLDALCASGLSIGAIYTPVYFTCKRKKHPAVLSSDKYGIPLTFLVSGDTLPLENGEIRVLGPVVRDDEIENNNSLVLLVSGAGGSMLLTGDMEFPEEKTLLDANLIPKVDLLKIANHGESDATSEALLRAAAPSAAVISTNSDDEPDTPSGRVLKLLNRDSVRMACTQNASSGVLAVLENGQVTLEPVQSDPLPDAPRDVRLTGKDNIRDTVSLMNTGDGQADISGWYLLSERGGEIFVFPAGTVLPAGGSVTVSTLASDEAGHFVWQEKNVWHNKKDDRALLYDAYGRLIDVLD